MPMQDQRGSNATAVQRQTSTNTVLAQCQCSTKVVPMCCQSTANAPSKSDRAGNPNFGRAAAGRPSNRCPPTGWPTDITPTSLLCVRPPVQRQSVSPSLLRAPKMEQAWPKRGLAMRGHRAAPRRAHEGRGPFRRRRRRAHGRRGRGGRAAGGAAGEFRVVAHPPGVPLEDVDPRGHARDAHRCEHTAQRLGRVAYGEAQLLRNDCGGTAGVAGQSLLSPFRCPCHLGAWAHRGVCYPTPGRAEPSAD